MFNSSGFEHFLELATANSSLGVIASAEMHTANISIGNRSLTGHLLDLLVELVAFITHIVHLNSEERNALGLEQLLDLIAERTVGLGEDHHLILIDVLLGSEIASHVCRKK